MFGRFGWTFRSCTTTKRLSMRIQPDKESTACIRLFEHATLAFDPVFVPYAYLWKDDDLCGGVDEETGF